MIILEDYNRKYYPKENHDINKTESFCPNCSKPFKFDGNRRCFNCRGIKIEDWIPLRLNR
jgi:predicted amidophosphoribosyltransferase